LEVAGVRERERDGRLGCVLVEFAKAEEKRKEKIASIHQVSRFLAKWK
jgi:hypothetical protein